MQTMQVQVMLTQAAFNHSEVILMGRQLVKWVDLLKIQVAMADMVDFPTLTVSKVVAVVDNYLMIIQHRWVCISEGNLLKQVESMSRRISTDIFQYRY